VPSPLANLGAYVTISLTQDGDALEKAFQGQFADGVDVVVDYLWRASAERAIIAGTKAGKRGGADPLRSCRFRQCASDYPAERGASFFRH
jgi:hypothetical protein